MAIGCQVCFESYTNPGTEHAPYSATCGHVMGKSCMITLKEHGSKDEFNCPFCDERIVFERCHPIYLMIDEIVTSTSNNSSTVEVETLDLSNNVSSESIGKININIKQPLSMVVINVKGHYQKIKLLNHFNGYELINGRSGERLLDVSNLPYYYGKMKREDADRYFDLMADVGDFIIRDSETHVGDYVISLKGAIRNRHFWIKVNKSTNEYITMDRTFKTLFSLIDFFKIYPISVCERTYERLYLIKPLLRNYSLC
uniref:RING-type domain-containing protein n=1 Tax=Strongyloides papillosus TaxID=174720 RepID=A0A0N5C2F2_STREA